MGFLINNKNQSVVTREVSGVNVGSILEFPKGTTLPASFLEANGGTFDQNVWPDLYKFLGSNKLPNGYISDTRVGDVKWFQNRNAVPYGWTAADGNNVIPFSDFPDVKAAMDAGRLVTVTESVYTSDSSKRASWANATTGFRTPDYNGKSAGSLGSLFLRGDGGVAAPVGTIQGDAIRNITGSFAMATDGGHWMQNTSINGVFRNSGTTPGAGTRPAKGSNSPTDPGYGVTLDASMSVPTSTENRPLNTAGCWAVCLIDPNIRAIKAAGFVDNDGLLSAVGVLKQVSDLRQSLVTTNTRFGKWYKSGTPEFNRLFGAISGSVWSIRDGEVYCIETSTEIRIRGIIRGDQSPGPIGTFLQFKNPDKIPVGSPYNTIFYLPGLTSPMTPTYCEPIGSTGNPVNILVLSEAAALRAWLMIDIVISKV